jgi:hypothetical protein
MSERRYTEDEVSAIFERASETERTLPASSHGAGLTLTELHDIARQVGISPESVSLAAESLNHTATPASATFLGLPIAVGRTVEFNRKIADSEWESLVADLRTTFAANGRLRYDGPFRQWMNGNLKAVVEPTPAGSRLRLLTMNANARMMLIMGLVFFGASLATLITSHTSTGFDRGSIAGIELLGLVGAGLFLAGAARVRVWARLRMRQFEEVIARIIK